MKRADRKLVRLAKRTWVYVQRPVEYEVAPCSCGNSDPDWSEYRNRLWCPKCRKDFIPDHWGIFDGPIPVGVSELMGIYFDRIDVATGELLPDPWGKRHYTLGDAAASEGRDPQSTSTEATTA